MYSSFQELKSYALRNNERKRCVLVGSEDKHAVEAIFKAAEQGYVFPVLVGSEEKTNEIIGKLGFSNEKFELHRIKEGENVAQVSVSLIKEGRGDFLLKGKIETKDLLKAVLSKRNGINKNKFITHFGLMEIEGYHKLIAMSDAVVIPYPNLEDKKKIIQICVQTLQFLGIKSPTIAALCAVEQVNEKMIETVDARKLQKMSEQGELGDCKVLGPISYDIAMNKEAAIIKGYESEYAGDVDMLLVPQMVTGNIMSKIWNSNSKNNLAGCLVGAEVPIGLTSRSAKMSEKLNSILLCSMLCKK